MTCLGCLNWHLAEVGQVFGGGGVGGVSTGSAGLQIYKIYSKVEACLKRFNLEYKTEEVGSENLEYKLEWVWKCMS